MVALVSVETVLLVALVVLVAGLLRSHAEILRRLGPAEESPSTAVPPPPTGAVPQPPTGARQEHATPVAGTTPDGDAVALDFAGAARRPTLLAFLSTGCSVCGAFWGELGRRALPGVQTVIVTHGTDRESPARLRTLAPSGVPVVMSSRAFHDYGVPGSPYFVLVEGSIRGEGSASTWDALSSLVRDAIADADADADPGAGAGAGAVTAGRGGAGRTERVDEILAAAGIGPGHPSLYPGQGADEA